jgi:hypothetical protein
MDTHTNPDPQRANLVPDISVYVNNDVPDDGPKTNFSMIGLFIELKLAKTSDTFGDPKDPMQPQAENFRFENDSIFS